MKKMLLLALGVAWLGGLAASVRRADGTEETFDSFRKRDREAYEIFRSGKRAQAGARAVPQAAAPDDERDAGQDAGQVVLMRAVSPERQRGQEIYDAYCRLRRALEDPDPERGLDKRITGLRGKLFPTNRPWVDSLSLWGDREWDVEWPLLQDLEARAAQDRAEMQRLAQAWEDEGFRSRLHRSLHDCYGRTAAYIYLDRADQSVFPSPIRTNQVDYVNHHLNILWPIDEPVSTASTSRPGTRIHEGPPPPDPPVPETEEIDETIRTENIETMKAWDDMTPEERRRALMENRPEAWSGFARDIFGTDTNGQALARQAVVASNVTAVATNIAIANLPPPAAVRPVKPWADMTVEERHAALKGNRAEAWDAVRDALLSGDPARIRETLDALSARPAITETARAVAYWHGYNVGTMEAATKPESSTLALVVAAYKVPELMTLVREGYADAQAGRSARYGLPGPGALQQMMPPAPPTR